MWKIFEREREERYLEKVAKCEERYRDERRIEKRFEKAIEKELGRIRKNSDAITRK